MERVPFRELVGGITWMMTCTRPDLAFAVQQLGQHSQCPKPHHWEYAKRVLRYVAATKDYGLTFGIGNPGQILEGSLSAQTAQFGAENGPHCYTDADWANCPESRRSVSGFSFMLNGDTIAWMSKKQSTVARSSTEAEYQAADEGGRESQWLRSLLREAGLDMSSSTPLTMHCDNQGAIALANSPMLQRATKHVATMAAWLRERVAARDFHFVHIPGACNPADIFTKSLPPDKFLKFRRALGIVSPVDLSGASLKGGC